MRVWAMGSELTVRVPVLYHFSGKVDSCQSPMGLVYVDWYKKLALFLGRRYYTLQLIPFLCRVVSLVQSSTIKLRGEHEC